MVRFPPTLGKVALTLLLLCLQKEMELHSEVLPVLFGGPAFLAMRARHSDSKLITGYSEPMVIIVFSPRASKITSSCTGCPHLLSLFHQLHRVR
jgi:hypothetical protein